MFRAFCSLVLCCVFSSAGVGQVRPNPARVSTSPVWEYGELFYVDMRVLSVQGKAAAYENVVNALVVAGMSLDATFGPHSDSALGPVWLSADTTLFGVLDSAAAQPNPPGRVGPATLIRLLNVLGARGWELVSAPSSSREITYVFKRQLSPAAGNPVK